MHTEGIELVPFSNLNSFEANWQRNSNLTATDLPQPFQGDFPSGSFSMPALEEPITNEGAEMEFQWHFPESVFTFTFGPAPAANASEANPSTPLTGDVLTNSEAVLGAAVFQAREQLETFANDEDFLGKLNQAFSLDVSSSEAKIVIEDLASGETMPEIEIVSASELDNANAAFGAETIYVNDEFLSDNSDNPDVVEGVLLEEIGHYVDRELSDEDSSGDEGDIFAQLVRDETIGEAELNDLQAEDDSATISIDGEEIDVELDVPPAAPPYPGYLLDYNGEPDVPYDENVELWQEQMEDLGYDLTVDGLYGPESESVTRQFQEAQGLAIDGIVGPNTWEASFAAAPPYPGYLLDYDGEPNVSYDENVELWQEQMRYLGYDLTVDGLYGPESESIAREFQEDEELAVDGIVGPNTWEASFAAEPNPGDDESRAPYTVEEGDTLSEIAEEELGDSSLWREIEKEDGTTFTEEEATGIQPGDVVYLPTDTDEPGSPPDYAELVPIPPNSEMNQGLTSPSSEVMYELIGDPGNPETGEASPELEGLLVGQDVSTFDVDIYGLAPAVDALERIFTRVEQDNPELYEQLGYSGMYNLRPKIDVDGGYIPGTISNHSWGTAIDINIGGTPDLSEPDGLTNRGLVELYPYFNEEGFYWGAEFSTNEDPIHFEASQELLEQWRADGLLA
jgi:peptidoglycan hydrolase-like protein with peptidoglycan-binding domain